MNRPPKLYVIGSLANPVVPALSNKIRTLGYNVFDDWFCAGEIADIRWTEYERGRGHGISQALKGHAARNVFNFDKSHLTFADIVVLVMPSGRSGHLELGWALGQGKKGFVLFDKEPEKFDVMYAFADDVFTSEADLLAHLGGLL